MAGVFVSPGIYVLEKDLSDYVPSLASSIFGVVGVSSWGPLNTLTDITNENDLVTQFGPPALGAAGPNAIPQPLYPAIVAAIHYMRQGRQLKVVRVSDGTEVKASVQLPDAGIAAVATSNIDLTSNVDLSTNHLANISINGGTSVLVDLRNGASVNSAVTRTEIVSALTSALAGKPVTVASFDSGANKFIRLTTTTGGSTSSITFTVPPGGAATAGSVTSSAAPFDLQFTGSPDFTFAIDGGSNQNFNLAFTSASATSTGTAPFALVNGDTLTFQVKLPGQTTFLPTQTVTFATADFVSIGAATAAEVAAVINRDAIGINATVSAGAIVIKSDKQGTGAALNITGGTAIAGGKLNLASGTTTGTGDGADATAVTASELRTKIAATLTGATASVVGSTVKITSSTTGASSNVNVVLGQGIFGSGAHNGANSSPTLDATDVVFFNPLSYGPNTTFSGSGPTGTVLATALYAGTRGNAVVVKTSTGSKVGTKYTVNVDGFDVEVFDNIVRSPTTGQVDITQVVSSWVVLSGLSSTNNPASASYTLVGGADGVGSLTAASYIGSVAGNGVKTGLQLFKDADSVDVNILAVPGDLDKGVTNSGIIGAVEAALDGICSSRGDCMFVLDPPLGLAGQQGAVDWHNGAGTYSSIHAAFNTSYGATYWAWVMWYDNYSKSNIWAPPSGFVAQAMAFTDFNADPWIAPAGLDRGRIREGLAVEHSPDQGERDNLYSNGNSINPIVNFHTDGIVIWGQRTLQRTPTALDRINVRRLMLYLRKVTATAVKRIVFEPNDSRTWQRFKNIIEPFLREVQSRRGLIDFKVIMDETTNTATVIDRNEMRGRILLKPTKAAEIVVVEFTLLPTGATFAETA